ncbi:tripartite tricarboxylate transporter substrate-binding protein [Allopusillimonas ginsengisoli]|uniref:tripartite tricarboxylate transporter substrate-binding protein n=1 Tax=Allopusillimonas ginsengisoli TaxID=453575 RepID=UPI00101F7783|nr:tripartite tricarboxylate transporter substrate-binding protein [Allopusillimonas ginsengisoli]TEA71934.1 tripartite tricarboxylate transporter substrate binding protein BugD [Allopusillimonas ginsengisoli]
MYQFHKRLGALFSTSLFLFAPFAQSADYPERPITMIVPFSAGGPSDNAARSLAEALRQNMSQTILVENRGGAGGTIGISYAANAAPDGYTILQMHAGFTTAPSLYKKPGYDAKNSFDPIGLVLDVPMTLIARSDFPANNIQELVDYVKAHPDDVTIGNAGIGSAAHLCGIMLSRAIGVDILNIPYKGTGPAMNDLLGKQIDLMCDQTTNTTQHILAHTVKAYAVTSPQRMPALPELPTMTEAGFKDFEVGIWVGLWAPKGTPAPILDKLVASLQAATVDTAFTERMKSMGATVLVDDANPEALSAKVDQELVKWAELFRKAGVEPQ